MNKNISENQQRKHIKYLSNQIGTRNLKEKKAWQAELARKLDANVRDTNLRVLFAAFRACVQGPIRAKSLTHVHD